jgi:hypothetical protein
LRKVNSSFLSFFLFCSSFSLFYFFAGLLSLEDQPGNDLESEDEDGAFLSPRDLLNAIQMTELKPAIKPLREGENEKAYVSLQIS